MVTTYGEASSNLLKARKEKALPVRCTTDNARNYGVLLLLYIRRGSPHTKERERLYQRYMILDCSGSDSLQTIPIKDNSHTIRDNIT